MSPRPGRIVGVVDVELGERGEKTREDEGFFHKISEVRELLRGIEAGTGAAAFGGVDDR
jgi:NitT/TauT family transport system ATP-binding protein